MALNLPLDDIDMLDDMFSPINRKYCCDHYLSGLLLNELSGMLNFHDVVYVLRCLFQGEKLIHLRQNSADFWHIDALSDYARMLSRCSGM
jgi:hypothetical protein